MIKEVITPVIFMFFLKIITRWCAFIKPDVFTQCIYFITFKQ
jgi:hypothetical protein